ncbi:MAG TPA: B12-binding domain-containing protein, partial [Thermoleophilia bacterium]|nr:B12-binding domain-containing protein [Thermoleophilia bacterium]
MAFDSLQQAVLEGDADEAARLVQEHLDEGAEALDILDNGLIAAMDEVGARFSAGDLFIPEMLIAAEAMQAGLSLLKPLLVSEDATGRGIVIIGAVKGDLHDIGKNLVALMLEGAG